MFTPNLCGAGRASFLRRRSPKAVTWRGGQGLPAEPCATGRFVGVDDPVRRRGCPSTSIRPDRYGTLRWSACRQRPAPSAAPVIFFYPPFASSFHAAERGIASGGGKRRLVDDHLFDAGLELAPPNQQPVGDPGQHRNRRQRADILVRAQQDHERECGQQDAYATVDDVVIEIDTLQAERDAQSRDADQVIWSRPGCSTSSGWMKMPTISVNSDTQICSERQSVT